jgi:hypothetical protein
MFILIFGREGYCEQDYTKNVAISQDVETLKQRALEDESIFDEQFSSPDEDLWVIEFNPDSTGHNQDYYLICNIEIL